MSDPGQISVSELAHTGEIEAVRSYFFQLNLSWAQPKGRNFLPWFPPLLFSSILIPCFPVHLSSALSFSFVPLPLCPFDLISVLSACPAKAGSFVALAKNDGDGGCTLWLILLIFFPLTFVWNYVKIPTCLHLSATAGSFVALAKNDGDGGCPLWLILLIFFPLTFVWIYVKIHPCLHLSATAGSFVALAKKDGDGGNR